MDLEVKQELEEIFVFKSLLGQGSFGCVYECEDKRDGQIYAVKVKSLKWRLYQRAMLKRVEYNVYDRKQDFFQA